MKAILTGMNGTVAPAVAEWLKSRGHRVVRWDRAQVSPENADAARRFILQESPDCFFHIATGSVDWAESIARVCVERSIKMLFTSSVSVFSNRRPGPFPVTAEPDATDDYGRYKIECERRTRAANPRAIIARLGWQIGDAPGSNNMVDFLHKTMARDGRIVASENWFPACSFLADTADALVRLMADGEGSIYHVDGNPGLNFHAIAGRLNRLHGGNWNVVPVALPAHDTRLLDERIKVAPITARLPA